MTFSKLYCRRIVLAALVAGTLLSCSNRPKGVLSDKEAASLLADLHIADTYVNIEMSGASFDPKENDSIHKVFRQSIMAAHGVTEAQLDTTLGWYGHNLDKYEDMYELVLKNIEEKQKNINELASGKQAVQSLWPYGNTQRVQGSKDKETIVPYELNSIEIPKGGRLQWDAKTINSKSPVEFFMAVEYTDGSTGYLQRNIMGDGKQTIALQTDSSLKAKRLYGYMRVRQDVPLFLDSISLRVLPLNTTSYYEIHSVKTWSPRGK